ncbi:uncharacterized protein CDAR_412871 [Caerostris darwini]|uniref:Uncharacterized protein n=1 Tax=Caerostris darwini TaxID=1538125 RepID=A0AAV4SK16_9ARAC|nr:uncharacterized protein CDAR_412871 [Caerostris darwini]
MGADSTHLWGHYVLNWSNPFVQEEYRNAIDHWLEAGVDGFYMKHLDNMHVIDTHDISSTLQQWRHTLDGSSPTRKRVLIASSNFAEWLVHKLGLDGSKLECIDLLDHPLLVGSGEEMGHQVDGLRKAWPEGWPIPMWHLGSSDTFRIASRIEPRYHMAATYLLMTLSGANSVFYGDEIGLKDTYDYSNGRHLTNTFQKISCPQRSFATPKLSQSAFGKASTAETQSALICGANYERRVLSTRQRNPIISIFKRSRRYDANPPSPLQKTLKGGTHKRRKTSDLECYSSF